MPLPVATLEYRRSRNPLASQPHRWALVINGQAIAGPQEGYTSKVHALYMALRVLGLPTRRMPTFSGRSISGGNGHYDILLPLAAVDPIYGWDERTIEDALGRLPATDEGEA